MLGSQLKIQKATQEELLEKLEKKGILKPDVKIAVNYIKVNTSSLTTKENLKEFLDQISPIIKRLSNEENELFTQWIDALCDNLPEKTPSDVSPRSYFPLLQNHKLADLSTSESPRSDGSDVELLPEKRKDSKNKDKNKNKKKKRSFF